MNNAQQNLIFSALTPSVGLGAREGTRLLKKLVPGIWEIRLSLWWPRKIHWFNKNWPLQWSREHDCI